VFVLVFSAELILTDLLVLPLPILESAIVIGSLIEASILIGSFLGGSDLIGLSPVAPPTLVSLIRALSGPGFDSFVSLLAIDFNFPADGIVGPKALKDKQIWV